MDDRVLSVKEFCDRYGICLATAYTMFRTGKVRAVKLGRRTVLLASDVRAWEESLPEFRDAPCPSNFVKTAKSASKRPAQAGGHA
jgi:excisionase family DNA binding protein